VIALTKSGDQIREGGRAMSVLIILFSLSAAVGFALGISFSYYAIAISGIALAFLAATVLHVQGFDTLSGIAIIAACLTVNQIAYLGGVFSVYRRSAGLVEEQAND
jgi:hypothetical protein